MNTAGALDFNAGLGKRPVVGPGFRPAPGHLAGFDHHLTKPIDPDQLERLFDRPNSTASVSRAE